MAEDDNVSTPDIEKSSDPPPEYFAEAGLRQGLPWKDWIARYGLLIVFAGVLLLFKLLKWEIFLTTEYIRRVIFLPSSFVPLLLLGVALTFVMAMGDFDLSFGSMMGLAGGTAVALMVDYSQPVWVAMLVAFGVAAAGGLVNGLLVAYVGVSSFVITLAGYVGLEGIEQLWTNNRPITIPVDTSVAGEAQGEFIYGDLAFYVGLGRNIELGLGRPVWIAFGIAIVAWVVMDRTELGRYMYAIGGNQEAARLSGIPVARIRALGFLIVAIIAALVGILSTGGLAGTRLNLGEAFLLDAYAAVFLGAAVFRPGQFSIPGTVVGALFLRVIDVGLQALQIRNAWINIAKAVILIIGVLISQIMLRKR